jgi:hypothetical protein
MKRPARDITRDLQLRLDELENQKQDLEKRLDEVNRLFSSYRLLLEHESHRWTQLTLPDLDKALQPAQTKLSQTLLDLLSDRQDWPLHKLVDGILQTGYNFGDKSPGRVVHYALVGMRQHNLVERVSDGVWRIGSKDKE